MFFRRLPVFCLTVAAFAVASAAADVHEGTWVVNLTKLTSTIVVTTDGRINEAKGFVGDKLIGNEVSEKQ